MTKGALKQRYIMVAEDWHRSNLYYTLSEEFGMTGPGVWYVLYAEWREPEAAIVTRTVNGQPIQGFYRRCRFSYLWDMLPKGVGNKKLARIMLWLHEREQWVLDPDSLQSINSLSTVGQQSAHRTDTQTRHLVGAWSDKWLAFREGFFPIREEKKREDIGGHSNPSNQDQTQPDFDYVRNPETGEWDHVSLAEKELRESIDD